MSTHSRLTRRVLVALLIVSAATIGYEAHAQTRRKAPPKYSVAANTILRLRLREPLTSKTATVGQQFSSTVVDPVYARGFQVIPPGSVVTGKVTHVTGASRKSNAGSLNVAFNGVQLPNGRSHALNGSLASSDSADNEGEVKGGS